MAHIIAYMDEVLGSGFHGFSVKAEHGNKRRGAAVPRLRARGLAVIAVEDAPLDHADVRMDRVRALRAAIADGSYKVSASDLADSIMRSMLSKG